MRRSLFALSLLLASTAALSAQITTPKEAFGFNIGDDYHMADYGQMVGYFEKLAGQSDRMKLVPIGKTSEGRTQWMAIVSSPANLAKVERYREIAAKLAHADGVSEDEAHAMAREGKSIVWIDGGLHAGETVGAQQLIQTVYRLVSGKDPETMRELEDTISLCVIDNPDGMDMVADWYMREPVPEKRTTGWDPRASGNGSFYLPRLWHHYAGHDDNRDFFMSNLAETTNINRVLFREWFPQIMYNHHQAGPTGTVIFVPPFRDPFNYHYDPLIPLKIESVGMAIHTRLVEEGKPGSVMRSVASYSTWYNGGLRTVTYFHNMIGILTEIIGSPNPMEIPLIPARQLPSNDQPDPVRPGVWHYRQSIDYEVTNNRAILDFASRNRETLLFDTWKMAHNSIVRGSEDSWTVSPKRIEAVEKAAPAPVSARGRAASEDAAPGERRVPTKLYGEVLHDPAHRDPRVYVMSADQRDFATATKFVNTLMKNGVTVMRATAPFAVGEKRYPAESYVVRTAQAYRPHILDMFEPQDHPNDFRYPGGPPVPPYDVTGYTLAMQMGVQYDRFFESVEGPFAAITTDLAVPPAAGIVGSAKAAGFVVSHGANDATTLAFRLLKAKLPVFWLKDAVTVDGKAMAAGALWVPASGASRRMVEEFAKTKGVPAYASAKPAGAMTALSLPRIALYDRFGGVMPSGWLRFLFEQFEIPYTVLYPQEIDGGGLRAKYDVVVMTDGGLSATSVVDKEASAEQAHLQPAAETIPAADRALLGWFSKEQSVPSLAAFAKSGGRVVTIGSSTMLAQLMGLPVTSALTEVTPEGTTRALPHEKFYIPGSLLEAHVNNALPLGYGMPATATVFFDNSPAFRLQPAAVSAGAQPLAWYGTGEVLQSGWAWGQSYLHDAVAAADVPVGKGDVVLLGPEVTFRGQPHGTFKLLFNALLAPTAK